MVILEMGKPYLQAKEIQNAISNAAPLGHQVFQLISKEKQGNISQKKSNISTLFSNNF